MRWRLGLLLRYREIKYFLDSRLRGNDKKIYVLRVIKTIKSCVIQLRFFLLSFPRRRESSSIVK
jgi:hypothetical protein